MNVRRTSVLILLVLILLAAGCTSSSNGVHWRGQGERHIQVRLNGWAGVDSWVVYAVGTAADRWSSASPWVELHVAVGVCQPNEDCMDVLLEPLDYPVIASATSGWDSNLHMYGRAVVLRFASNFGWDIELLVNAGCHEIAHGLGLDHSLVPGVQGPCQGGWPTSHDVQLVNTAHAHDDGITGGLTAEEGQPGTVTFEDTSSDVGT